MRVATAVCTIVAGCGAAAAGRPVTPDAPPGWVRVDDPRGITFSAPPGVHGGPVAGIDSQVAEYVAGDLQISYDLGFYSNPLCDDPVLSREVRTVNGRPARIVTTHDEGPARLPYAAAIYFPTAQGEAAALMVEVQVPSQDAMAEALALLATVVWHAKASEPLPACPRLDVAVTTTPGGRCRAPQGEVRIVATVGAGDVGAAGMTVQIDEATFAITEDDGTATRCLPAGPHQVNLYEGTAQRMVMVDVLAAHLTRVSVTAAE